MDRVTFTLTDKAPEPGAA